MLLGCLTRQAAFARSHPVLDIDRYCSVVRNELSGTTPFIFSGPEPWTELDEAPGEMPDEALAYVYTQGPAVRWVFVRWVDEEGGWQEDIQYYFRVDGTIAKRVRRLQSVAANVELDATTYYQRGAVLKEVTHHHALSKRVKPVADFSDPDAPQYLSVDDLPFPEIPDLWRRLA